MEVGAGLPEGAGRGLTLVPCSPVNDAVALRVHSGILEQTGATAAVLQSDTMDHYRTFHMLERLLHAPPKLLHQLIFQIPPSRQALLIERWARQPLRPGSRFCRLNLKPPEGMGLPPGP